MSSEPNRAYYLRDGDVQSRVMPQSELVEARELARKNMDRTALRSCWVCNPAHSRFLEDLNDGFLLRCFDCGRIYFEGKDLTA